jgi:uncharacterized protein (TIGR00288 family)
MLDERNLALFCDFENIAIGVRDAAYDRFDIQLVLGRLLDKGKIVVKKAYADWDRYKTHKRGMHEAAFELIEIPHVSYSGKNSADIRLVVDALDLCYTKSHVDTFVVLSGDSDFSPLVSKLRENNKQVIGLGVKNSTSDLLIENCDEFIYYDDLVRKKAGGKRKAKGKRVSASKASTAKGKASGKKGETQKADGAKADGAKADGAKADGAKADPKSDTGRASIDGVSDAELAERRDEAIELVLDTVEALFSEREGNLWGSMIKQTLKRKKPNFDETFHGYATFSQLLEDAQKQGLLEIQRDDKSGGYQIHSFGPNA